ncbi:MAG: ATP-binding cassette domain-containing protein [Candidatus Promineifilaceae bacterium]
MTDIAVQATNLGKSYPQRTGWRRLQHAAQHGTQAVQNVNLSVREGELFGLLGPNGAGKTTLAKMLCTLILPTTGTATVAGYALEQEHAIKKLVGLVVTDERSFYWRLSARRNLAFFAALHGMHGAAAKARIDAVLDSVQLLDVADRRFSDFSTGMRQRLAIARGLIHRPKILFLDEPSRSLDPTATNKLHDLILHLKQTQQMTVFLITHDLNEAEKLCDRVAIMHKGRVRGVGSSAELRQRLGATITYKLRIDAVPANLTDQFPTICTTGNLIELKTLESDDVQLNQLLNYLHQHKSNILNITSRPATLDEVFLSLTSQQA